MEDGFQFFACFGINKYQFPEVFAPESPVFIKNFYTESIFNFPQGRQARFDDLVRDNISIDYRHAQFFKFIGNQGLARSYAASQYNRKWRVSAGHVTNLQEVWFSSGHVQPRPLLRK